MSSTNQQGAAGAPWQDREALTAALAANEWSNRRAALALGCGESVIRKWRDRLDIGGPKNAGAAGGANGSAGEGPQGDPAGIEAIGADELRVTLPLSETPQLGDVDALIRGRGMNPDEWDVERVKVNEWSGFLKDNDGKPQKVQLEQLTAHLKRKRTWDFLFPAATAIAGRVFARPKATPRVEGKASLIWVGGDQQADYHDRKLHEAVCLWMRDVQPDELAMTGDTVDLPTISRHDDRPHWNSTPQECLDAAYVLLYDYCDAVPNARKRKLRGNHDWRLEAEMLKRAERLWGLRPAKRDGEDAEVPLYSLRRMLRLDELGIELCGVEGDKWELGEIEIAPDLVVMHRPPSQAKLTRLNRDIVAGDSHRQKIEHVTTIVRGVPVVRTLMQVGLLAEANGLGYTKDPDWQQGFGTITLYPDGTRSFELASWDGRALTWRGETWKP